MDNAIVLNDIYEVGVPKPLAVRGDVVYIRVHNPRSNKYHVSLTMAGKTFCVHRDEIRFQNKELAN